MKAIIIPIIILFLFLLSIVVLILIIKSHISNFLETYFGTRNLKEAIEISEIENENTPKSIASMERVVLPSIKKDFPELNINELKSMSENVIIDYLNAIEKKDVEILDKYNSTIKSLAKSKIEDNKDNIVYDNIKIHKTVINNYEKKDGIASINTESSLEYYYIDKKNIKKKTQTRYKVELIYIIDASIVPKSKKNLGLNCPNCGAPITTLGKKECPYCNTEIKDIVKRVWTINNIKEY